MDFAEGGLDFGFEVMAGGVDGVEEAAPAVVVDEGEGLAGVDVEAVADGGRVVVLADGEGGAAGVAEAVALGGEGGEVEGGAAGGADAAAGDAGHEDVVGDFEEEGAAEVDAFAREKVAEEVGLGEGAGEAVEEEDVGGGVGVEDFFDHLGDEGVGDEVAGVHVGFGLEAGGGALLDGTAQEVAGGEVADAGDAGELGGEGAFAGAGCAKEDDDVHGGLS